MNSRLQAEREATKKLLPRVDRKVALSAQARILVVAAHLAAVVAVKEEEGDEHN